MTGKIYIASMNMRGEWAPPIDRSSIIINVTSAQSKSSKNRRDFSPMTPVEGGYKGYWNFESYWQSGKVFEGIPEKQVKDWWKKQLTPMRRYPPGKNKKILWATFDEHVDIDGQLIKFDYITARKRIYVPEYYDLVKNREMLLHWTRELESGKNITIYDFDGPRDDSRKVQCMPLTLDLLKEKIADITHPFGHGYVIAATIAKITPDMYTT